MGPQTTCWPTSTTVHNDIQPVPCSVCHTLVFQEVHHHPVPKKTRPACMKVYHPVTLTSVVKSCEQLIKEYIFSSLLCILDTLQFAYCSNRSTKDAIAHILHTILSHLNKKGRYMRLLFIDYSSVFSTIVPSTRLVTKLKDLGWILDFQTGRPQVLRVRRHTSSTLILNTRAPQSFCCPPCTHRTV